MAIESQTPQINAIRLARVSRVYPAKHCVDVVFLDDGGFASGVPVLTAHASQRHGLAYLPSPAAPDDANGRWSLRLTGDNDSLCAVAWAGGTPVVIGFYFPAGEHMAVAENEKLERHVSGYSEHVTPDGDLTISHPSGWTVRVQANGGIELKVSSARLHLSPNGRVQLEGGQSVTIKGGGATIRLEGGKVHLN